MSAVISNMRVIKWKDTHNTTATIFCGLNGYRAYQKGTQKFLGFALRKKEYSTFWG